MNENVSIAELGTWLEKYQTFALMSHMRPDGDAIGSQLGLGLSLEAMGKTVHYWNVDGLPESLAFLAGSEKITKPPEEAPEIDVAIALDTATRVRLGEENLLAAAKAKVWLNIDHHISNPLYGDVNYVDATSPATGQIVYEILQQLQMPLPAGSRDAIYVAVSTDTGSFQYDSTTAKTYRMAADLVDRGLKVGEINAKTYDSHPYRRIELLRALLNTLELSACGKVAHWQMLDQWREDLALQPDDSEGLIDMIRAIRGVQVAVFFEELPGGKIRVSMRSKDRSVNVCDIATRFGGGGHALAAGIRMAGPMSVAKQQVLAAIDEVL
ncbi:MAG: bifunctional oligoribonuclease/PAP phosphatase NrnA [Verrucomicrobia bacterium]|jgi:phosphoesterase RecJ-like protein|nr:MAG: bifunctional oligoribonuclease/PAP phosphatase NrnA [Verrucomicrobiota bacterium]